MIPDLIQDAMRIVVEESVHEREALAVIEQEGMDISTLATDPDYKLPAQLPYPLLPPIRAVPV